MGPHLLRYVESRLAPLVTMLRCVGEILASISLKSSLDDLKSALKPGELAQDQTQRKSNGAIILDFGESASKRSLYLSLSKKLWQILSKETLYCTHVASVFQKRVDIVYPIDERQRNESDI